MHLYVALLSIVAVCATATPISSLPVIVVPLVRTASPFDSGVLSPTVLQSMIDRPTLKYLKTSTNAYGRGADLPGFSIKNSQNLLNKSLRKAKLAQRQAADPLTDVQESYWTGPISIGTPSTTFAITFDTGSADLWLPLAGSAAAYNHKTYNASKSSTSIKTTQTFSIKYGDGSTTSGPVYNDTVTVAGLKATGQLFAAVTQESSQFSTAVRDGILGLGFHTLSSLKDPDSPVFQTLWHNKQIPNYIFSMALGKTGSELYLGGSNPSKYKGGISFFPVVQNSPYYQILGSMVVNGTTTSSNKGMLLDSGTTLILANATAVAAFWKPVKGAVASTKYSGYYEIPCATLKSLKVQLAFNSTFSLTVSPTYLNLGSVTTTTCLGGVAVSNFGLDAWIVGDIFMRGMYSVFDANYKKVGFATLA